MYAELLNIEPTVYTIWVVRVATQTELHFNWCSYYLFWFVFLLLSASLSTFSKKKKMANK